MSSPNAPERYEKRRTGNAVFWLIHGLLWMFKTGQYITENGYEPIRLIIGTCCIVLSFWDVWYCFRYHLIVDEQGVQRDKNHRIPWTEITRIELRRGKFLTNDTITLHRAEGAGKPLCLPLEEEMEAVVRCHAPIPIEEAA